MSPETEQLARSIVISPRRAVVQKTSMLEGVANEIEPILEENAKLKEMLSHFVNEAEIAAWHRACAPKRNTVYIA